MNSLTCDPFEDLNNEIIPENICVQLFNLK